MSDERIVVIGRRVLTPEGLLASRAVEVRARRIFRVAPVSERDRSLPVAAEADIVAPGFIDIQINGAADRLLNDDPSVATMAAMAGAARKGGTAHLLPTLISSDDDARKRAVIAAKDALGANVPGVLGLHLEGPFLNPAKKGAHEAATMRGATMRDVESLTLAGAGVLLVTLAPEIAQEGVVAALAKQGAIVFAGHTDGRYRDYGNACAAGLSGFTHLFNAMSQMTAREPGAVGAALVNQGTYASIIADGVHVAPANLMLAARLKRDRLILVTDAMPTLGGRRDFFLLGGRRIELRDGRLLDEAGTLSGAHLAMDEAVANMIGLAGVAPETAMRMASRHPAAALGLGSELGEIAPGYRASLTLLGDDMKTRAVMVDGALFSPV